MTTTPAMPEPLGWYVVNNIGMATLCKDEAEAQLLAEDCDMVYQRQAPHRAVQLVALAALQSQPAGVSDAEIDALCLSLTGFMTRKERDRAVARAILALRPQAVPMTEVWFDGTMRLADAYADACFDQGLNQRTEDPNPEAKREKLVEHLRGITAPAGGER